MPSAIPRLDKAAAGLINRRRCVGPYFRLGNNAIYLNFWLG